MLRDKILANIEMCEILTLRCFNSDNARLCKGHLEHMYTYRLTAIFCGHWFSLRRHHRRTSCTPPAGQLYPLFLLLACSTKRGANASFSHGKRLQSCAQVLQPRHPTLLWDNTRCSSAVSIPFVDGVATCSFLQSRPRFILFSC